MKINAQFINFKNNKILPFCAFFFLTISNAFASNFSVEGLNGKLNVIGYLTEGTCWIDFESENVFIDMGEITSSTFKKVGDRSEPIPFLIKLHGCTSGGAKKKDYLTGNYYWDSLQPIVDVTFFSTLVESDDDTILVKGVHGVGLKISDEKYRDIKMGVSSKPLFLMPGYNEIVYHVQLIKTSNEISKGYFYATSNFVIDYQ